MVTLKDMGDKGCDHATDPEKQRRRQLTIERQIIQTKINRRGKKHARLNRLNLPYVAFMACETARKYLKKNTMRIQRERNLLST